MLNYVKFSKSVKRVIYMCLRVRNIEKSCIKIFMTGMTKKLQ